MEKLTIRRVSGKGTPSSLGNLNETDLYFHLADSEIALLRINLTLERLK